VFRASPDAERQVDRGLPGDRIGQAEARAYRAASVDVGESVFPGSAARPGSFLNTHAVLVAEAERSLLVQRETHAEGQVEDIARLDRTEPVAHVRA